MSESEPVRRSVEVEYWVTDESGRLTSADGLTEASSGVEREFVEPLLEIKTDPCATTDALREQLLGRIRRALRWADERDKRLVPLATPLDYGDVRDRPSERTSVQDRILGPDFEYVRHCAGTHIHVEQQPGCVVDQFNTFVALDPALALVNSAPHFRGRPLATGARSQLYRRLAYESLPGQGQLWPYLDAREEWEARLQDRYESFVAAADDAGVDRTTVEDNFDPESAVWTPVQLRDACGTVEWRSPDTALPGDVLRLADRLASAVETLRSADVRIGGERGSFSAEEVVLPRFDAVREYVDTAIQDGLSATALESYLDRMGFTVPAYEPIAHQLEGQQSLTRDEARRLRLAYADRLEHAVRQTRYAD